MAVHVRLSRHGSKGRPFYYLVAQDHKMRRDGRFIEKLGTYDPGHEPSKIDLKEDRIRFWYERGAQLTPAVEKLLKAKSVRLERKAPGAQAK